MYMQVVEPIAYLFTNREEPTLTRYYAQECLCIMTKLLQRTLILEVLFECLSDEKQLYDQFCDRIDAEMIPFLSMVNGVPKVEYPLPQNHVFSVRAAPANQYEARDSLPLHPRRLISD